MTQNRLYFGYGSNLDWNDWVQHCEKKGAHPDGLNEREPAWLVGHHLKFHYHSSGRKGGAADVVPINEYHATPGALFDVDECAWSTLVAKEGAPSYYEEKSVLVIGSDGQLHEAVTFVVCDDKIEPDFVSALKLCKRRRIGPLRPGANRELFYKKDMGILARGGFNFDLSKRVLNLDLSEFNKLLKII